MTSKLLFLQRNKQRSHDPTSPQLPPHFSTHFTNALKALPAFPSPRPPVGSLSLKPIGQAVAPTPPPKMLLTGTPVPTLGLDPGSSLQPSSDVRPRGSHSPSKTLTSLGFRVAPLPPPFFSGCPFSGPFIKRSGEGPRAQSLDAFSSVYTHFLHDLIQVCCFKYCEAVTPCLSPAQTLF